MNDFKIPETRDESPRPSREVLKKIKEISDENLKIINSKIKTDCENQKRDLIVNMISALDYYIHAIVIWGIIEITENQFPKGKKYDKFEISIRFIKQVYDKYFEDVEKGKQKLDIDGLKSIIVKKLSLETYQKWESIKEGLKIILPDEINKQITSLLNEKNKGVLEQMNNVRNSTVHNFDRNLYNEGQRNNFILDCQECLENTRLMIDSIHGVLIEYEGTEPEFNDRLKIYSELNKKPEIINNKEDKYYFIFKENLDSDAILNKVLDELTEKIEEISNLYYFISKIDLCECNNPNKQKLFIVFNEENEFVNATIN